jgi:hypothetical protein
LSGFLPPSVKYFPAPLLYKSAEREEQILFLPNLFARRFSTKAADRRFSFLLDTPAGLCYNEIRKAATDMPRFREEPTQVTDPSASFFREIRKPWKMR